MIRCSQITDLPSDKLLTIIIKLQGCASKSKIHVDTAKRKQAPFGMYGLMQYIIIQESPNIRNVIRDSGKLIQHKNPVLAPLLASTGARRLRSRYRCRLYDAFSSAKERRVVTACKLIKTLYPHHYGALQSKCQNRIIIFNRY